MYNNKPIGTGSNAKRSQDIKRLDHAVPAAWQCMHQTYFCDIDLAYYTAPEVLVLHLDETINKEYTTSGGVARYAELLCKCHLMKSGQCCVAS